MSNIDQRAAAESAEAKASGMECGHAAPEVLNARAPGGISSPCEPPAAVVSERCWRRIAPTFVEQCANDATGGVRLKLFPALSIQKRYGKRVMLAMIFDLPVCQACFVQMTALEVLNNQPAPMWATFSKLAQQGNNGILPIKECSEIEHIPFEDPDYVLLRRESAKRKEPEPDLPTPEEEE